MYETQLIISYVVPMKVDSKDLNNVELLDFIPKIV